MADPLADEVSTDALLRTAVPPSRTAPPLTSEESEAQRLGTRSPGLEFLRSFFMPAQSMKYPDTAEANRVYAEALAQAHAAGGGKVPPMPGSQMFTEGQGTIIDLLQDVGPKGLAALKVLGPAAKAIGGAALHTGDPLSLGLIGGALHPSWISQRLPVAAAAVEDPLAEQLSIDVAAMKATPKAKGQQEGLFEKTVKTTRNYPNMAGSRANSTEAHAANFLNHVSDNLKWLYNQVPQQIRDRSKLWYEGANRMAQGAAKHFDIPLQSAAGVYAALSPRKEWFMNVSLGDRLMYIWKNHQNTPWSELMTAKAVGTPEAPGIYADAEFAPQMQNIMGKTYAQLQDPFEKAMWVRIYDEANHDPNFLVITPEGDRLGASLRKDQQPKSIVWAGRDAMAKAIQVLESHGDRAAISQLMGEKHKVRNFYMNILDPHSPTLDVTIDTHAIAAALLRPLGLGNKEVKLGLGAGPGSDITGARGAYGLYAEAYRRTAKELGISPRELQSIVWEAVRGLYPDTFKTEANQNAINAMWQSQAQGVTADAIRQQILKYAGGINPPEWHGIPPGGLDPAGWYATLP